ncbi:MAG TPA: phenylacetate--CoA ligase [Candidatus Omnitrophota bacterium]|nr:phenylacetate--CoA ligase [Candidatus Omnitrophota bacterium]HPD84263.1 phenylacetate--CoA ligase [Candidatus Omnitrophota bacterium]HRZ03119.1 phenylacetate--CoA ligase [Candidatus Omnitrophota bacterium]
MIYNEKFECMSLEELKNVQSERLKKTVSYVYQYCPFYQKKFASHGISPKDIKTIDDIVKLPFTVKDDLRDNYPFGVLSMPLAQIAEIHVSSGTTGNPTVVGYSKEDIELWSEVMARAFCCAGGLPGDMVQVAYGYGLFTGGLGAHYGALKAGMTVIPCSSGQTKRQLKIMQDFKPRILACTPSYSLFMADEAKEIGMDCKKSSWEIGVFGAEPWSDSMRKEIESIWNLSATDIYGLSEIIGPGVAQECTHKDGLHLFSDVFYPEVINPKTGKEAKEGETGMLVLTHLTKTGMPLLRYQTRDIIKITHEKCRCGRTSPRISKILGRTDDMIIVRGINVFPSQIEEVLLRIEGTEPHYQLVVERPHGGLDELEVQVELKESFFSDEVKQLQHLSDKIRDEIESVLGIGVKVRLVEPKTIARSEGKAKRVIDKRNI